MKMTSIKIQMGKILFTTVIMDKSTCFDAIPYFMQTQEHEKRCWSVDFNRMDPKLLASGSDDSRGELLLGSSSEHHSSLSTIFVAVHYVHSDGSWLNGYCRE